MIKARKGEKTGTIARYAIQKVIFARKTPRTENMTRRSGAVQLTAKPEFLNTEQANKPLHTRPKTLDL